MQVPENPVHGPDALARFVEWLKQLLDQIFFNRRLPPLKPLLTGIRLECVRHPVLGAVPIPEWLIALALDLAMLIFRVECLLVFGRF